MEKEIRIRKPSDKLMEKLEREAEKEGLTAPQTAKRILLKYFKLLK